MSNNKLTSEEKIRLMAEFKQNILNYFTDQLEINHAALKAYENDQIKDDDSDIRKMREIEAIKIRHSISELTKHIAVIKLM